MANEPEKQPYFDVNDEYMLCRPHAQQALGDQLRPGRMTRLSPAETSHLASAAGGRELCADCIQDPRPNLYQKGVTDGMEGDDE